jgi:hypothetical protein
VVLKVDLHYLVRQTEHYSVTSAHPLFNIDNICYFTLWGNDLVCRLFIWFWFSRALQVTSKVLQKGYFLLECWWVFNNCVLLADILSIRGSSLNVIEVEAVRIKNNFSCVVEEHADRLVAQVIPKSILTRIINPFFNPHFFLQWSLHFFRFSIWSSHWTTLACLARISWLAVC